MSRVAIDILLEKFSSKPECLRIFGSRSRVEMLDNDIRVCIDKWSEVEEELEVRFFIPTAFLTVDKFQNLGELQFRRKNIELINRSAQFIAKTKPKFCILISSGIVNSNFHFLHRDRAYHVYRELKLHEEKVLKWHCQNSGTNLVVCRLFSASGLSIRNIERYAISNLIYQGLKQRTISVQSDSKVFRKYVDMHQLLEICFREVHKSALTEFDSTGALVELRDLANMIAKELNISETQTAPAKSIADKYYSISPDMENLAVRNDIRLYTLEEQVRRTIRGIKNSIQFDLDN